MAIATPVPSALRPASQAGLPTGHRLPSLGRLPRYQRFWLRLDLIAGLTVVALLAPEGMTYAQITGVPHQSAWYAAPIDLLALAIVGSSCQMKLAVSAAVATMSFASVNLIAQPNTLGFLAPTAALARWPD